MVKNAVLRLLEDETPVPAGAPELPVWHLGVAGPLHRRDIYDVLVYAVDADEPHHAASRALLDAAVSELQPCTLPHCEFIPS